MEQMVTVKKAPSPSLESRILLQILPTTHSAQPSLEENGGAAHHGSLCQTACQLGQLARFASFRAWWCKAWLGARSELGTGGKLGIERVQTFVVLGLRCM